MDIKQAMIIAEKVEANRGCSEHAQALRTLYRHILASRNKKRVETKTKEVKHG